MAGHRITQDELSKHTSEADCWIAVHGKVGCDVTPRDLVHLIGL